MANTQHITENRLTAEANNARKNMLLYGTPVTIALCFAFPSISWWFLGVLLILFLNAGAVKRAGAKGEDATLAMLSTLPTSYTILNQVRVPNSKSRTGYTELDFVVMGPNGVFVIEVKNNNSRIVGAEDQTSWKVRKIGRKGTPYTATMRNPIKQLKHQIWVLNNWMKQHGHKQWVEGVVFFSNSNSSLKIEGETSVPVLHKTGLVDFILNYKPRYTPMGLDKLLQEMVSLNNQDVATP